MIYRKPDRLRSAHVKRLCRIRVPTEVAGITLDGARAMLKVIDDLARGSADMLATAQDLVPLAGAG